MFLRKVKTINTPIIRQLLIVHLVPDVCSAIQQKALIHESSMLTPLCCKLSQARAVRTTGSRAGNGLKWEDQRRRRRSKMRRVEMGTNQMEIGGGRAQRALWQATSVPFNSDGCVCTWPLLYCCYEEWVMNTQFICPWHAHVRNCVFLIVHLVHAQTTWTWMA